MKGIQRLDQYLANWEGYIDLHRRYTELARKVIKKPFDTKKYYNQVGYSYEQICAMQKVNLRQTLLVNPAKLIDFTENQFTINCLNTFLPNGVPNMEDSSGVFRRIPYDILRWFAHSKKDFHVSDTLKMLLDHTDIYDMYLDEVLFPFETFLITLETSVTVEEDITVDSILFLRSNLVNALDHKEYTRWSVVLLGSEQEQQLKFLEQNERKFLKAERDKDSVRPYAELLNQVSSNYAIPILEFHVEKNERMSVSDMVKQSQEESPLMSDLLLLPLKVAVYLMTLKSAPTSVQERERFKLKKAVTKSLSVDVFALDHEYTISSWAPSDSNSESNKDATQISTGTPSVVFRRGHLRRKPGMGRDPNAPKVVWVRPTLVNRHLAETNKIVASGATIK